MVEVSESMHGALLCSTNQILQRLTSCIAAGPPPRTGVMKMPCVNFLPQRTFNKNQFLYIIIFSE